MFIPWPDIESFYNLRRNIKKYPGLTGESNVVTYRSKIKLHGTNAGVRINNDGTVYAQSRTQTITPFNDNMGFARWVAERAPEFAMHALRYDQDKLFYGEWCGPGVQKGVAISNIDKKIFVIFAMALIRDGIIKDLVTSPDELMGHLGLIDDVHILPWFNDGQYVDIDFDADGPELETKLEVINAHVAEIEKVDPWVATVFGVEGVGEGLVFYPTSKTSFRTEHEVYELAKNLFFKAKGEKHKVIAKVKAVQAEVPVVEGANEFAEMVLPLPRLEQGARAVAGGELQFDIKKMGEFLKWIAGDVKKETLNELLESGLDGKVALSACTTFARNWYLEQVKNLGA